MKKVNLILTVVTIIFLLQNSLFAQVERFPDMKFYGEAPGNNFGFSATDAGDVNGDGYGDILIGAPYYNSNKGRAYVFFGGPNMDNIPDIILTGQASGNYFGKSVSTAGNVNGDGFKDILISKIGATYIYFGSSNFDTIPDLILIGNNDPGPMNNISDANDVNNDGFDDVLIGVNNSNYAVIYYGGINMDNVYDVHLQNGVENFGFCVSSAGDFNKDGFGDVIIGQHDFNSSTGRALIYLGGSQMDSAVDLILNGELNNSIFGHTVSNAGDVNGDGSDDVIVGAPYYNNLLGRTYIYFGGVTPNNTPDVILPGQLTNSHFGHTVSKAGDFNRDGFKDIIIGSITYNNTGRIDVYYGGANMNTVPDLYMLGNNDQLGFEVSTAGDVNGDGDIDLLASARNNDDVGTDAGIVYLFLNPLNEFTTSVTPRQNAIDVAKSSDISVSFSQTMNPSTINSSNIKVFGLQTGKLSSSVSYNAGTRTATINPNSDFKVGEKIQVTLSSGIQTASNTPITPLTWTFTVQALGGTAVFTETVIDTAGAGTIGGMDLLCGDFNGDNKNDIAAINYGGDTYIYTNTGNANFSVTQIISVSGLTVGGGLTAGDFDSDGDLDLLMSFYDPTQEYFVYLNNGNGNFTLSSSGTPGIYYCETADLDRDGDLDVVGMWYGTELRYLINDGAGNFTPHSIPGKDFTREICDVENDGDLDIICANGVIGSATGITVLINDGNANFSVGNTSIGSSIVLYASAQDYDSDGDMDIVSNEVIFLNDGAGNFSSSFSPGIGITLVSGDFDADGDIDNAFSKDAEDDVEIFKNNSSGVFTTSQIVSVGNSPVWSTSCDFDEDGDIDIAVANYLGHKGQNDISILLNDYITTTYNIKAAIEGYYSIFAHKLSKKDTMRAYLRNVSSPFGVVDSAKTVIDSVTFTGSFVFINAPSGNYYIQLKHRNGLETWSKSGGETFTQGSTLSYDFTSSASQAYENNLIQKGSKYCIYSGDVNQDGIVDLTDLALIDLDASVFAMGYLPTDLDGDNIVDVSDMAYADNNAYNFVIARNPIVGDAPVNKLNKLSKFSKFSKDIGIPNQFELKDNYPNPFNPTTKINYELPITNYVTLKIYDITGKEVVSLVNENQNAGRYSVEFNGSNLSSGTYFYKIVAGGFVQVKRMILVK